ncbi:hypothetical protein PO587_19440 [Streptomyces gilvifuscus]|uniref:DUF551 domain-containing protein n=1 Tax=Streptomyces gilvifuscus TaxID=1550617 RepID=A0ABT5FVS8_9ACTN|nr:hypothetical protein [Streptomyces gilvifuscus]MDC2956649.1 hypothetical protein [Streptomyces gilvifuscus]
MKTAARKGRAHVEAVEESGGFPSRRRTTGHRFHNGDTMMLACWTTGDGDADGHGDHYWFALDFDSDSGYINDWYVTTGSPSQWQPHVPHCR